SRRRHTISKRDWSSDVCSSDLGRTIKSVIVNMLAWGTLGGWLYFAVMGGYAMDLQLTGAFNVVQSMADNGNAQTIINVLNTLPQIGRASCREREENSSYAV